MGGRSSSAADQVRGKAGELLAPGDGVRTRPVPVPAGADPMPGMGTADDVRKRILSRSIYAFRMSRPHTCAGNAEGIHRRCM